MADTDGKDGLLFEPVAEEVPNGEAAMDGEHRFVELGAQSQQRAPLTPHAARAVEIQETASTSGKDDANKDQPLSGKYLVRGGARPWIYTR